MMERDHIAPGWPGIPARWTSSAKSGVGAALSPTSRVWFTLSHGILDEIYHPRLDWACTRGMGLIVTDGEEFFSEEKRHTHSQVAYLASGVPAYRLTNTCMEGRYSKTGRRIRARRRPTRSSARTRWRWCASGYGRPTIPELSIQ
jgi:glucoamylase